MRWFGVVAAGALSLPAGARAQAHQTGPEHVQGDAEATCEGSFSVLRPKPQRCLEVIETDRPHKTDTPKLLAPGHAQIEMGVLEYEIARLGVSSDNSLVLMNNIYKLGVVSGVELDALHAAGAYAVRGKRARLDTRVMIRSKVNVLGGEGSPIWLTLVPAVIVPLAKTAAEAGGFVFIGGELPWEVEIELNLGGVTETDSDTTTRHYVPVVTGAITRRLVEPVTGFVELYNHTTTADLGKWSTTADSGLLFLLHENVQLDAGAYVGLWGNVPAITPFCGLSVRL
jgi:hypothetical protein